jgi:hypothetical protein
MGETRNAYRILVEKPEETLGRPRCKWEDNIRLDLKRNRMHLAQDRDYWRVVVNMGMKLQVHKMLGISE